MNRRRFVRAGLLCPLLGGLAASALTLNPIPALVVLGIGRTEAIDGPGGSRYGYGGQVFFANLWNPHTQCGTKNSLPPRVFLGMPRPPGRVAMTRIAGPQ